MLLLLLEGGEEGDLMAVGEEEDACVGEVFELLLL